MHLDARCPRSPRKLAFAPCLIGACLRQSEARALAIGWHVLAVSFAFLANNQGRHMALAALGDDIIGLVLLLLPGCEQTFDMAVFIDFLWRLETF